jgi:hypothetical protein
MASGEPFEQRRGVPTGAGPDVEDPFVASKWK